MKFKIVCLKIVLRTTKKKIYIENLWWTKMIYSYSGDGAIPGLRLFLLPLVEQPSYVSDPCLCTLLESIKSEQQIWIIIKTQVFFIQTPTHLSPQSKL